MTGLTVPPNDPDSLAGALNRLLDEPELAQILGARGRERALECFNAERMVDETHAVYQRSWVQAKCPERSFVTHEGAPPLQRNMFGGIETFLLTLARLEKSSTSLENRFLLSHHGRLSTELESAGSSRSWRAPGCATRGPYSGRDGPAVPMCESLRPTWSSRTVPGPTLSLDRGCPTTLPWSSISTELPSWMFCMRSRVVEGRQR